MIDFMDFFEPFQTLIELSFLSTEIFTLYK